MTAKPTMPATNPTPSRHQRPMPRTPQPGTVRAAPISHLRSRVGVRPSRWSAAGLSALALTFTTALATTLALPLVAHADSRNLTPRNELKAYTPECGACHLAYPPGFLPAASWRRMMGTLDNHYGSDASLDAATVNQISGWLQANAGTYKRVAEVPPQDRITRSAWFERKHRRIATPQVWKHASVKSAANCMACHTSADKGNYDDDSVRFPQGLDERFRAAFVDD
jgi:mono/diheme cytochrome c family protein